MIRRKKTTIFTDAKESTPVSDVKKIVEGILKIRPEDQKLFKDDQLWRSIDLGIQLKISLLNLPTRNV